MLVTAGVYGMQKIASVAKSGDGLLKFDRNSKQAGLGRTKLRILFHRLLLPGLVAFSLGGSQVVIRLASHDVAAIRSLEGYQRKKSWKDMYQRSVGGGVFRRQIQLVA